MSSLYWFAARLIVIFITVQRTMHVKANVNQESSRTEANSDTETINDEWIDEMLHSTEGFLAGENTPVWTAYRASSNSSVIYTKLAKDRVKRAVDYWKSPEFRGFIARTFKDVQDKIPPSVIERGSEWSSELSVVDEMKNVTERSSRVSMEFVYPSVLIMMDYAQSWPADALLQEKLINEKILYALAFWYAVDLQLRYIQAPKVRLRISGIIIAQNEKATPYIYDNRKQDGLQMPQAHKAVRQYWQDLAKVNQDFPLEGYHIVATMTSSKPEEPSHRFIYGISTKGPPCNGSEIKICGLIFPDNEAFGEIQTAVHEIAHSLGAIAHDGDSEECPLKKGYVMAPTYRLMGRTWSECSLKQLSYNINRRGSCLGRPREFRPSGKPIKPILPGKLMPASIQCERRGWKLGWKHGIVCMKHSSCNELYCKNNHWWSKCRSMGVPADGTECATGKICLYGKCVNDRIY